MAEKQKVGLHTEARAGLAKERKRVGRGAAPATARRPVADTRARVRARATSGRPPTRGRPEPRSHADAQAARPHKKMSMPFEKFRTRTQPVNLSDLDDRFKSGDEVTSESLRSAGLARRHPVKVLARGEALQEAGQGHAFSAQAKEKIEAAGGTCEVIEPGTASKSEATS